MRARYGAVRGGVLADKSCRGDGGGLVIHNGFESALVVLDLPIVLDSYLYDIAPDTNYGDSWGMQIQIFMNTLRGQPVMVPSFAAMPVGKTILSAILWMRTETTAIAAIGCHRLLVDYVELEVTYNDRKTGVAWSAPGAVAGVDYVAAAGAQWTPVNNDWGSGDITALMNGWYRDGWDRYGMLLRHVSGSSSCAVISSDSPETDRHPFVRVTYS